MKDIDKKDAGAAQALCSLKTTAATAPLKSEPNWQPEPCGLTRAELRKIIAEQLG